MEGDPPNPCPPPAEWLEEMGFWGCEEALLGFIARPGSLALSPLALKVPPRLAAPSVGGVCPLLTHTFSEPTTIFHSTSPPPRCRFLAANGPSLPPSSSSPPLPSPLSVSPPKRRRPPRHSPAPPLSSPSFPRTPLPRPPARDCPGLWPWSTQHPLFSSIALFRDADPLRRDRPSQTDLLWTKSSLLVLWWRALGQWERVPLFSIHDQKNGRCS